MQIKDLISFKYNKDGTITHRIGLVTEINGTNVFCYGEEGFRQFKSTNMEDINVLVPGSVSHMRDRLVNKMGLDGYSL